MKKISSSNSRKIRATYKKEDTVIMYYLTLQQVIFI